MKNKINADYISALKNKDNTTKITLSLLKSEMLNQEKDLKRDLKNRAVSAIIQ